MILIFPSVFSLDFILHGSGHFLTCTQHLIRIHISRRESHFSRLSLNVVRPWPRLSRIFRAREHFKTFEVASFRQTSFPAVHLLPLLSTHSLVIYVASSP
jgi:hypothetical protein